MKVLITGAGGMVGRALAEHCAAGGDEVCALNHHGLDITDAASVAAVFERERSEAVFNCAAWTDVDGCESDPERARAAHAWAVETLAVNCRQRGASFLTISTDYVFDGDKEGFYTQRDEPNPQSVYGVSKLEGERLAQTACARTIVVRTGWIFGPGGSNFLSRVIELGRNGQTLKAIHDSYGTPTYAPHLAARLRELAVYDLPGVYHVVNAGEGTSFADFARAALDAGGQTRAQIESVSASTLKRPAPRPRNSRLRCLLSEAIGLAPLPDWRDALKSWIADDSIADCGLRIADSEQLRNEEQENQSSNP